ncbi:MAG: hydroxymethylglutaryl-CoA lyase [Usitatibacteraceae bacterium]
MQSVLISEVGPRDGLQSIKRSMPTAIKQQWIRALAAAGLREIEAASFVPPKLLPQMADAPEVVRDAIKIPGVNILVLAPNLRGVQNALAAGALRVTMPVSASEAHSQSNIRKSCVEAIEEVSHVCRFRDSLPVAERPFVEANVATAFGCTLQGEVSEDWVIEVAVRLAKAGADSVGLSDSVGYGNPVQVKRMFTRLRNELGGIAGAAHMHNTRGQGLANVVAAIEAGCTTIDASQGGIGGCPYAPGATGNVVTEDVVYLLESMGMDTGVDLEKLIAAREVLLKGLPGETVYGYVQRAGVHKGFRYANSARGNRNPDFSIQQSRCDAA